MTIVLKYRSGLTPWTYEYKPQSITLKKDKDIHASNFEEFKNIVGKEKFPLLYKRFGDEIPTILETEEDYTIFINSKLHEVVCWSKKTNIFGSGDYLRWIIILSFFLIYSLFVHPLVCILGTILFGYILKYAFTTTLKRFDKEVQQLKEYGYTDTKILLPLLEKHNGDIIKVIVDIK